jgi:pimeloyl-ACP methyl ester carboxylesterase
MMATFVLVHGSHSGAWVWQKVSPLLHAQGHTVFSPTLTGLSDRSHLADCGIDLTTHITDVTGLLFYEDLSEVVLVGHSYGGMVITGVAAKIPERLKMLIYLDAYLPEDVQSEFDLLPPEMRTTRQADAAAHGGLTQPPPPAILGVTDPGMADWVKARWTPQPVATYEERVPNGSARSSALPRAYILCLGGPATTTPGFAPFAEKAKARDWPVRELTAGHMAMLTAPREVADLLLKFSL